MDRVIYLSNNDDLNIDIKDNDNIIVYLNSENININYKAIDAKANILFIVDYDGDMTFNEKAEVTNSNINEYFFDLSLANIKAKVEVNILDNSNYYLTNKYLVKSKKEYLIDCINVDKYTTCNMDNSAVSLDGSELILKCTGKIVKGAKGGISHQKSRSLIYGDVCNTKIDPILLIEESDVEASHALSSGTIDEDTLYYLNSRGISNKDALELLVYSYLLPSDTLLDNFDNKDKILEYLNKKVKDYVK